jgi:YVTN family beta-propeller protein
MRAPLLLAVAMSVANSAAAQSTPSPALLVLNKADAELAIVDPSNNRVIAKVGTGQQPHEVAVSEDGKFAFVTNYGSGQNPGNSLSVIDLTARTEKRVNLGNLNRPHGIAVSGGKVYFTAEGSRMIGRYDPATNRVDWTQSTNQETTHMVLLNRAGDKAFSSNMGSNSVNVYERGQGDGWSVTSIRVGAGPEAIDLSPDQREIWTAHSGDGGISVIDVASKKVVQTLGRLTQRPNRLKFTPDGKSVLISDSGNGDLVIVDAASRKEVKRIKVGSLAEGIQLVPDGSRAYVALERDNQVAVVDMKTLTLTTKFSTGMGPDGMAWAVRK